MEWISAPSNHLHTFFHIVKLDIWLISSEGPECTHSDGQDDGECDRVLEEQPQMSRNSSLFLFILLAIPGKTNTFSFGIKLEIQYIR